MTISNVREAKLWMEEGSFIVYDEKKSAFIKGDWKERIHRFFGGAHEQRQAEKIVGVVKDILCDPERDPSEIEDAKAVWKICVAKYQDKSRWRKVIRVAERVICENHEDVSFEERGNKAALSKWVKWA